MTGHDSTSVVIVCPPAALVDAMPVQAQLLGAAKDGPHESIDCPYCQQAMLLGKRGRRLLNSGEATSTICTECLLTAVRSVNA